MMPQEEDIKSEFNEEPEGNNIVTSSKTRKRPIQEVNSGTSDDVSLIDLW